MGKTQQRDRALLSVVVQKIWGDTSYSPPARCGRSPGEVISVSNMSADNQAPTEPADPRTPRNRQRPETDMAGFVIAEIRKRDRERRTISGNILD